MNPLVAAFEISAVGGLILAILLFTCVWACIALVEKSFIPEDFDWGKNFLMIWGVSAFCIMVTCLVVGIAGVL